MSLAIITQATANKLTAAYRPIMFQVSANQAPSGAVPASASPVVYADVYFDGAYYATVSRTSYRTTFGAIHRFDFDISDKAQEYLRSKIDRLYSLNAGMQANALVDEKFSVQCFVKFRHTYKDTDGFIKNYETPPVQGTYDTLPIAGTGTQSNTFYILNATLTHEDNQDLETHLSYFKVGAQIGFNLTHRPNDNYNTCFKDMDLLFFFSSYSIPISVVVQGQYKDGTLFTGPLTPFPTGPYATFNTYYINGGIPYMQILFPAILWENVINYSVGIYDSVLNLLCSRRYTVDQCGCCDNHVRVFFLNSMGTYDAVNFGQIQIINKTTSGSFQKSLPNSLTLFNPFSLPSTGINRWDIKQNDFYMAETKCYREVDMYWIKELVGTGRAYIQATGSQGRSDNFSPVIIEDSEHEALKPEDNYEYIVTIKFRLSNERIAIR